MEWACREQGQAGSCRQLSCAPPGNTQTWPWGCKKVLRSSLSGNLERQIEQPLLIIGSSGFAPGLWELRAHGLAAPVPCESGFALSYALRC